MLKLMHLQLKMQQYSNQLTIFNQEETTMADFKEMYARLWDFIYTILAIFGINKDDAGNLVK